ncbi:MAG: YhgE/Pip domain-containing protein [Clostridium luticellarii]|jgi:putative membrane protein|uniref:YhgE/Pip domain-containing protein n=1 Tax=Clostridium luticellarii TaxID=1691940 RepID=UPI0023552B8B|nr:YhgE/Pip domain-containing protein [Clostridium luticellarii]MCI2040536.1 YhgE/Pip domain-containing protein [Clostridium luticellarii]
MKTVFRMLKMDLQNIIKSFPVFMTILAFCLIPACYALMNINASWDPYSEANTGRLPIAVVNKDEGSSINGKNINLGSQIINELRRNKSMDWVMIDEWQGNYGLNIGKYYALIEIPQDFSRKLLSITTSHPEKPNIIYRSNEKLNPAATKITNTAKSSLADEIKTSFIGISSKEILKRLNSIGIRLNDNKPEILELKSTLEDSILTIENTKKYLGEVSENSKKMGIYLNQLKKDIPKLSNKINNLQHIITQEKSLSQSTRQTVNSARDNLSSGINEIQSLNTQVQSLLSGLEHVSNESENLNIENSSIEKIIDIDNSIIKKIQSNIAVLNSIDNILPSNGARELISALTRMENSIDIEKGYLDYMKQLLSNNASKDSMNSVIDQLSTTADDAASNALELSNTLYSSIIDPLNVIDSNIDNDLNNYNGILQSVKSVVSQLNSLADTGASISEISIQQAGQISKRLGDIEEKLNELSDKMKVVDEKSLNNIIDIMEKNPDQISNLLSSPVELKNVQLYNLGLFGYAVTPFYTTLSIWVGVLLLGIILTLKCRKFKDGTKINMAHRYFEKLFLFMTLSLIQTSIVLFGEFFIMGIKPTSKITMTAVALTSSITFTIIIFTLIAIFGNVGKGISAILMILQLFGTGGIYPIEIISSRLAALEPFLPFTYSINGLREAMAGPDLNNLFRMLVILVCFGIGFLLLMPLKKVFHKFIGQMESEFQKSGL